MTPPDRPGAAPLKIVLTGGACAGKTTLARALAARGADVVPEAAIRVIGALRRELGLDAQADWRARNVDEFQRRIAELQRSAEARASRSATLVVCDRGIPDGLAYLRHAEREPPHDLWALARSAHYDVVFVLDTLRAFRPRRTSGRVDDRAVSLALRDELLRVYRELGHDPIHVPELPVRERLAQIEAALEAHRRAGT